MPNKPAVKQPDLPALIDEFPEIGNVFDEQSKMVNSVPPMIRIKHDRDNGDHKLSIHYPESYFGENEDIEFGDSFKGIVFAAQPYQIYFDDDGNLICYGAWGKPLVQESVAMSCDICPQNKFVEGKKVGECSAQMRLFLLTEIEGELQPFIFPLPASSIKSWRHHIRKLGHTPYILPVTVFGLEDVNEKYRYARVTVDVDGYASEEQLKEALGWRKQYEQFAMPMVEEDTRQEIAEEGKEKPDMSAWPSDDEGKEKEEFDNVPF
jgi:hypothetical protein